MKYSKENPAGGMLVPLECKTLNKECKGHHKECKNNNKECKCLNDECKCPSKECICLNKESKGLIKESKGLNKECKCPNSECKGHNLDCKCLSLLAKGGSCDRNIAVARALQKERRRNKRREKENMWRRNNLKNAMQEPIVMHYPARSALQTLHKSSSRAQEAHYFLGGVNHDWVGYYERGVTSDQSCINEWNAMDSLESKRPPSPDSLTDKEETQLLIRSKLKEIMMSVDIDEVTSKYIRQRLEEDLAMDLFKFKSYIDQEMLVILGQMDAATQIFPHVYLGSEWNASNLDELQSNGVGYILNVTKEIDNFYPGTFDYLNVRVYDDEKTELLKHWDKTFKYITQVKEKDSRVLVHCKMGISRSASVVIAYAMKAFNMSLDEALALVKEKRSCIKPNQAFCSQLKTYEGILDASRQRHNILWRSKSETNLKSVSGQANRPSKNNQGGEQRIGRSGGGGRRKESIHKSTEELAMGDPTYSHHTRLPPPPAIHIQDTRRPKSWSPDEHTADLHFPQNAEQGVGELGESWRLSQSLNVQAWSAHVTLEHRNKTNIGGDGSVGGDQMGSDTNHLSPPIVEALNPLYTDSHQDGSSPGDVALQLSSSVKDRINEFESVQTGAKKSPSAKKGETIQIQNTVTASDDFDTQSSTAELDKVIETLLAPPGEDLQGSDPVMSQTKQAAQKHQAVLVPSQIWQEEKSQVEANTDSVDSPGAVKKDSITWPSGIVKKQKQDFEEKVKMSDTKSSPNSKNCESPLSRQNSSGSLTSHFQQVEIVRSPSYGRQDSIGSDSVKKDDPFSAKLDKVFDREERKQERLSTILSGEKETPSRNSSWGSFDSAVVLADRDLPSRQSSWGSCDTRGTVGTVASRNSSFGQFDIKQQPLRENLEIRVSNSNLTGTYFEKESGPFSPGTIRRNKGRNAEAKDGYEEETKMQFEDFEEGIIEDGTQSKLISNVRAYGPAPYRSPVERDSNVGQLELNDEKMVDIGEGVTSNLSMGNSSVNICIPDSTSPSAVAQVQPVVLSTTICLPEGLSCKIENAESISLDNGKGSSATEEVPLPGTVRQHKELLESMNIETPEMRRVPEKLLPPTYTRSQSSGDLEPDRADVNNWGPVMRSFSEKRAKFEGPFERDTEGGSVKKITQAFEKQTAEDDKLKQFSIRGVRKRSHSLERLSTSPSSPGCSSRDLLDQLLLQKETESRELEEESPSEEICVRNLVGIFEDSKDQRPPRVQTRSVRAKSDSCTPDKFLPPVPQRKSSLDYNFKPIQRAQSQPPQTPVRQMTPGGSLSPMNRPPSHKPPPGGRGQACGTEVRQRKQQGKTHPLTKLTRTMRENYHTM